MKSCVVSIYRCGGIISAVIGAITRHLAIIIFTEKGMALLFPSHEYNYLRYVDIIILNILKRKMVGDLSISDHWYIVSFHNVSPSVELHLPIMSKLQPFTPYA